MSSPDGSVQLEPLLQSRKMRVTDVLPETPGQEIAEPELDDTIRQFSRGTARRVLKSQPSGILRGEGLPTIPSDIELVEKADIHNGIIWPWNRYYRIWWHLTALGAVLTVFLAPYQIAFEVAAPGTVRNAGSILEKMLTFLFAVDIAVNFNLAFYKDEQIVFERRQIAAEYLRKMFWIDLVGVIPFQRVALAFFPSNLQSTYQTTYLMLSLLRLFRFARLHRLRKISDELRYNTRVSLLSFTLFRNCFAVVIACHFQACAMYFLARWHDFDGTTWLGPIVHDRETALGRYVLSLYWCVLSLYTCFAQE